MSKFIKDTVKNIDISGIRRFNELANQYSNVIKLTIGELDFHTYDQIKDSAIDCIKDNKTTYTTNKGILDLRIKIANKYHYTPEEVILTVGTTEGLGICINSIVDKDDEVIIITPGYVGYKPLIDLQQGKTVMFDSLKDDINKANLNKLVTTKTKAIITTSPNNPTGYVLSAAEMDEIKNFVLENDILLISDEIYSSIVFTESKSFASYKELRKNLIILDGFSKSHAMTGFRIGYIVSDISIINELVKVHQYNVTSTSTISQYAALSAFDVPNQDIVDELEARRDVVLNTLDQLDIPYIKPNGAFYVFFNIESIGIDSDQFCLELLEEYKVALIPGKYFLGNTDTFVRLAYSIDMTQLMIALGFISNYIKKRRS